MVMQLTASLPADGIFFAGELFHCSVTFTHLVPGASVDNDPESLFGTPTDTAIEHVIKTDLDRKSSPTRVITGAADPLAPLKPLKISTFSALSQIAGSFFSAAASSPPPLRKQSISSPGLLKLNINSHSRMHDDGSPSVSCTDFPQVEQLSSTDDIFVKNAASQATLFKQKQNHSQNLGGSTRIPNINSHRHSIANLNLNLNRPSVASFNMSTQRTSIANFNVAAHRASLANLNDKIETGKPKIFSENEGKDDEVASNNVISERIEVKSVGEGAETGNDYSVQNAPPPRSRLLSEHELKNRESVESLNIVEDFSRPPELGRPPIAPIHVKNSHKDTSSHEKMAWVFAQMVLV